MSIRIEPRSAWGAQQATASFGSYEALGIVIHNMQNNNRAPAATAAQEKQIAFEKSRDCQHGHMADNGWDDIGQNFTISRGGVIMEGRTGSTEQAQAGRVVQGAHASGSTHHNQHYFGIEIEGDNRQSDQVTQEEWDAAVELCAHLIAWSGKTQLDIIPHVIVVAGHTDCPGKFKDRVPALAAAATARAAEIIASGGGALEMAFAAGAKKAAKKSAKKPAKKAAKKSAASAKLAAQGLGAHDFPFDSALWSPPADAVPHLGSIRAADVTPLDWGSPLKGLDFMGLLPDGTLVMQTDLDTDADGSPNYKKLDPKYGRPGTAYCYPGMPDSALDAEKVPYIVMPGTKNDAGKLVFRELGFAKGDLTAVLWGGRLRFAIFGDVGPEDKIGEGSVRLVTDLGYDPFNSDGEIVRGIPSNVVTLLFKGSAIKDLKPANAEASIRAKAAEIFATLGGVVDPLGNALAANAALKSSFGAAVAAAASAHGAEEDAEPWSRSNAAHKFIYNYLLFHYAREALRLKLLSMPKSERFDFVGDLLLGQFSYFTSSNTSGPIASGNIFTVAADLVENAEEEFSAAWKDGKTTANVTDEMAEALSDPKKTVADLGRAFSALATLSSSPQP